MKIALGLSDLTIGARNVLAMIAYHAGTPRGAWASEATLAAETAMTERSVIRAIQQCEAAGYLTVHRRDGKANLYQVYLPAPVPVEDPKQRRIPLMRSFEAGYRATPAEAAESAAARPPTPDTESGVPLTQSHPTPDTESGVPLTQSHPNRKGGKEPEGGGPRASSREADASPLPDPAFRIWNEVAARTGLRPAAEMTAARHAALAARVRDAGGLEGWREAVEHAGRSAFLTGQKPGGYPMTLDQALKPEFFLKLREGNFDDAPDRTEAGPFAPDPATLQADVLASPLAGDAPEFVEALCERIGVGPVRSWFKDCRLEGRGPHDGALIFPGGFTAERVERDHGDTIRDLWRELCGGRIIFEARRAA